MAELEPRPPAGAMVVSEVRAAVSDPALHLADDSPPTPDHVTPGSAPQEMDYPGFVERALFVLDQTTWPRSWCLRLITWPYPLINNNKTTGYVGRLQPKAESVAYNKINNQHARTRLFSD